MTTEQAGDTEDTWSLECIIDEGPGKTRVYRIRLDGQGLLESTLLVEVEGCLTISGDLCPGVHGVVSPHGYTLEWFASATSPGYLRQKFLRDGWHRELAAEWIATTLAQSDEEWTDYGYSLAGRDELGGIAPDDHGPVSFRDAVEDAIGELDSDTCPGWGPSPRDMRVLCTIQRRFAALWRTEVPHG